MVRRGKSQGELRGLEGTKARMSGFIRRNLLPVMEVNVEREAFFYDRGWYLKVCLPLAKQEGAPRGLGAQRRQTGTCKKEGSDSASASRCC